MDQTREPQSGEAGVVQELPVRLAVDLKTTSATKELIDEEIKGL